MHLLKNIHAQDNAIDAIRRAIASDHLPHGLIFSGPPGVGKFTTAAALGAWLLCNRPTNSDACGKCENCKLVAAGTHPDFHVITRELARYHDKSGASKATALAINVVRNELVDPAARKTVLGRGKVFIVEQAHLMTPAAQNAMLKTLEEPAGRTLIVLITDHLDDLLATIQSRCQLIQFGSLPVEDVEKMLNERGTDAKTAKTAAELSDGSIGVALRWIADGVLGPASELSRQIDATLASGSAYDLIALLKKSAEAQTELAMGKDELASKDSLTRQKLAEFLSISARRLRQRLADAQEADEMDILCNAIESIAEIEKYLDANVNVSLALEQLAANFVSSPSPI